MNYGNNNYGDFARESDALTILNNDAGHEQPETGEARTGGSAAHDHGQNTTGSDPLTNTEDPPGQAEALAWLSDTYAAIRATGGFLVLWGDPAATTALAEDFAQHTPESGQWAMIRCDDPQVQAGDVRRALLLEGEQAEGWPELACRMAFHRVVHRTDTHLRLLICADATAQAMTDLFPHGTGMPVIVTTPTRMELPEPLTSSSPVDYHHLLNKQ